MVGFITTVGWAIAAYMVPVVAWIVWRRRKKDNNYTLPPMFTIDYTRGL